MPKEVFLKDYSEPPFNITHVSLKISVSYEKTIVISRLTTDGIKKQKPIHLDIGTQVQIDSVRDIQEEMSLDYKIEGFQIEIIPVIDNPTIEFQITLSPEKNKTLQGIYKAGPLILSQCEAEGFREITPFLDRPDVLSLYEVEISADNKVFPVLLSNGNLVSDTLNKGIRTTKWQDPFPKPCYLFALAVGNLHKITDYYETISKHKVLIEIYSEKESLDQLSFAMNSLKTAMKWDEEEYGREYDLDRYMIVATPHFNMGAMENKGLNIFNTSCLLAHEKFSTDSDFERVEAVVAHEYFHNWSGNRVTLRDWFQLSLKEGFTVFREQEYMATRISPAVQRINDVYTLKQFQFAEDSSSFSHSVRPESYHQIDNFYTYTVYEKGAEIIRMIQLIMGKDYFKKGAIHFFEKMDGKACTIEDLLDCLQHYTDYDLDNMLNWYKQPGTPELIIQSKYTDKKIELTFSQANSDEKPIPLPILFRLFHNQTGKIFEINHDEVQKRDNESLYLLEKENATLHVETDDEPILSGLLKFSAPVKVALKANSDNLKKIITFEKDACILQQAVSELFLNEISKLESGTESLSETFLDCFKIILEKAYSEPALYAVVLDLPRADQAVAANSPFDPVLKAIEIKKLTEFIGREFYAELLELFQYSEEYLFQSIDNLEGRAWRKLYHTLSFYMDTNLPISEEWLARLNEFVEDKQPMQLQITALKVFSYNQVNRWEALLEKFEKNYSRYDLLIDKLFSVYATIPSTEKGLSIVQSLESKYNFEYNNPNKCRSLYGAFSNLNTLAFHGNHLQSYPWFLEKLKDIDADNPQLSARLFQPFTKLPHYSKKYRESFLNVVESLNKETLSKNFMEQLEKLLLRLL